MRIAVSGSIATDHLMTFGGKFTDTLIAEKLDKISVSFLVGDLEIRRGGVAGNIAYGLGCLGLKPLLVGCVGPDFADYRGWLEDHGVDTSGVRTSATRQTARFTATNDEAGNQIASFYPGAMSEDGEMDIASLAPVNGIELVLIGAGGRGEDPLVVGPVKDATFVEPTGAGDAFRCGFLAATAWGLPLERAVQLGNLMAVHALETVGPQEYELKPTPLVERARSAYGDEAADDLAAHLPA